MSASRKKYTNVYRDDEIVITVERVRSAMPARSYEEKLADGATKKSYRKSHRYGSCRSLKHDIIRGKKGR